MRRRVLSALLLASVILLSGSATIHADAPGTGKIRVIHVSPGTPNIDVYLNRAATPAVANLGYGGATGFLTLPIATYIITIRPAGSPADSLPIFERTFVLSQDDNLNVVAIGLLTRHNSRGFLLMFVPGNFNPSKLHDARVQLIHASPSYGTVNVAVNDIPTLQDFLYGDGLFTGIDYIPGAYTFTLKPSKNDTTITVLNLPNVPLNADIVYTIIDYGVAGSVQSMVLADHMKAFVPVPVAQ